MSTPCPNLLNILCQRTKASQRDIENIRNELNELIQIINECCNSIPPAESLAETLVVGNNTRQEPDIPDGNDIILGQRDPPDVDNAIRAENNTNFNAGNARIFGGTSSFGNGGNAELIGGDTTNGGSGGFVQLLSGPSIPRSQVDGGAINLTCQDGLDGSLGGTMNLVTGIGGNANNVLNVDAGAAGSFNLTTGKGGNASNPNLAGVGGTINITSGDGGDGDLLLNGSHGGNIVVQTGQGGNNLGSGGGRGGEMIFLTGDGTGGNRGGHYSLRTGDGATATVSTLAATGGDISFGPGRGGDAFNPNPADTAGDFTVKGSAGGDGDATQPAARGTNITLASGPGGNDNGGGGASGGDIDIFCEASTGASLGGNITVTAGEAGPTALIGGNITLESGNEGTLRSGTATLRTPNRTTAGNSGSVVVNTGQTLGAPSGNSGNIDIDTGSVNNTSTSGDINIRTGLGGACGDILIETSGAGGGSGLTGGDITLLTGASDGNNDGPDIIVQAGAAGAIGGNGGDVSIGSGSSTVGTGGTIVVRTPVGFGVASGEIILSTGNASTGAVNTGDVTVSTGNAIGAGSTGNAGTIFITGGDTNSGVAGTVDIDGGVSVSGNGGLVNITGGDSTSATGGGIDIDAGNSTSGSGGNVSIKSGDTSSGPVAGAILITSGNAGNNAGVPTSGGGITISTGQGNSNAIGGDGGDLNIFTGNGVINADGGDFSITGGSSGNTTGSGGDITLRGGFHNNNNFADSGGIINIDAGSSAIGTGGQVNINGGDGLSGGDIIMESGTSSGASVSEVRLSAGIPTPGGGVTYNQGINLRALSARGDATTNNHDIAFFIEPSEASGDGINGSVNVIGGDVLIEAGKVGNNFDEGGRIRIEGGNNDIGPSPGNPNPGGKGGDCILRGGNGRPSGNVFLYSAQPGNGGSGTLWEVTSSQFGRSDELPAQASDSGQINVVTGSSTDSVGTISLVGGDLINASIGAQPVTGTSPGHVGVFVGSDTATTGPTGGNTTGEFHISTKNTNGAVHFIADQSTGPSVSGGGIITIGSSDMAGLVSGIPATGSTTVTFHKAYASAPFINLTWSQPGGSTAPGLPPYLTNVTASGFTINNGYSDPMDCHYHVIAPSLLGGAVPVPTVPVGDMPGVLVP